jgi:radical SAM superfamily enzyme YgiQ (UPF0313 family)
MKLLLLQPPIQDFYDTDVRLQPIGLCYLKAAVQKHLSDVTVKVVDLHHGWGKQTIPIPKELSYLKDYYPYKDKSPFCGFYQYFHFGASDEQIQKIIQEEAPDVVGISSLFSPYYREVLHTAKLVKQVANVPIIVGGSHVSADPLSLLQDEHVDFVICGEGERPLVEFLRAFILKGMNTQIKWSHIPNLGYQKGNEYFINIERENYPIQDIPVPDLSDFAFQDYAFARKPMAFMVTSRGCPHRCSFCSVHATFGYKYRKRSVDDIMQEIQMRFDQGFRVINFEDDNLTYDKDAMKDLCNRIIEQFADTDIEFLAMNGLSYMSLDDDILELMQKAHFTHLNVSLVTTDKDVKIRNKRPHTLTKYIDIITKAADLNFKILSSQILGLPAEPLESMIDTLTVAAELPVLIGASMFYLTPNSPIAKEMKYYPTDEDIIKSRLSAMAIETEHVSRDDLYTLFITTRILDFIKSLPVDQFEDRVTIQDVIKGNKLLTPYDDRTKIGLELLGDLLNDGVLYAATKQGKKPLKRFKIELFNKIWSCLEKITTQNQLTIYKEA